MYRSRPLTQSTFTLLHRLLALAMLLIAGCGPGYVNQPKNSVELGLEDRVPNSNPRTESFVQAAWLQASSDEPQPKLGNLPSLAPDGYFIGLSISGGGSRSANFAAACMFQLQRIGFLQKVQCISAVSGGSLPASYYCTCSDAEWNPRNVQEKLTHTFESDVIGQLFLPWNLIGLGFGTTTRSDLLAREFARYIFTRNGRQLTFADLRPDRPRLLINCSDMETGRPFIFDNSNFDLINSDLDQYPLTYAVTASSAIPIVMDAITLRDYSTTFDQYVHVLDGGVCDNLGVQALVNTYVAQTQSPNNPYPNGAILVVIDAGVRFNSQLSSQAVIGGVENILATLSASTGALVNRASSATLAEVVVQQSMGTYTANDLRNLIDQLQREHYVEIKDRRGKPVRVIHLSLSQVGELSSSNFGTQVNAIPTTFDIRPDEAYNLYKAAEILFDQRFNAKFKPLLAELNRHEDTIRPSAH